MQYLSAQRGELDCFTRYDLLDIFDVCHRKLGRMIIYKINSVLPFSHLQERGEACEKMRHKVRKVFLQPSYDPVNSCKLHCIEEQPT